MKPKTLIPLVIGLGVGFFAIKMGIDMVKKAKGTQEETFGVVVCSAPVEVAAEVTENVITVKQVPKSLLPPDCFTDPKKVIGRVTKMPIAANVPVTRAMLAPPGAEPGLGAKIPPGHRAVSVKVNEESSVAGFVTPGSRVDVSAVTGSRDNSQSKLILKNVEVGAVGQSLSRTGPDGKTVRVSKSVTLFLKPEQVQILNAATGSGKGRLRLALRGHGDDPEESLLSKLLKDALKKRAVEPVVEKEIVKPEPVVVAKVERHMVEVRRGPDLQQVVFQKEPDGTMRRVAINFARPDAGRDVMADMASNEDLEEIPLPEDLE